MSRPASPSAAQAARKRGWSATTRGDRVAPRGRRRLPSASASRASADGIGCRQHRRRQTARRHRDRALVGHTRFRVPSAPKLTRVDAVLAFDFETAKNTSLWTVSVAVLLALVAVWVVKEVVKKVFTVVILLAIAGLAWSQRAELTDCADEVQHDRRRRRRAATRPARSSARTSPCPGGPRCSDPTARRRPRRRSRSADVSRAPAPRARGSTAATGSGCVNGPLCRAPSMAIGGRSDSSSAR